ncbi:MAG: DUF3696 domain-containing protein [Magnetococcales bacterium]|nr:DUF3696 domain-containing protein [Magnetococcales bacterium]
MFKSLRLVNFKAWRDTGEVKLAPVTMLLGANSSGKSSLIQSLLLLKQTVQSPDPTVHLNLGGDEVNDIFDFGGFHDVLNKNASEAHFEIHCTFDTILRPWKELPIQYGIRTIRFDGVYGVEKHNSVITDQIKYSDESKSIAVIREMDGAYNARIDGDLSSSCKRFPAPTWGGDFSLHEFLLHASGRNELYLFQEFRSFFINKLYSVLYLGPLRRKPERVYKWNNKSPGIIGNDGNMVMEILVASDQMRNQPYPIIHAVSEWLARMQVAEQLEIRQLGSSSHYEVVVRHKNGMIVNLRDVGIGISQVLPVLTAAYFAPEGSTIILEEPEIHLHPSAQSLLAELFVEVSEKRNVQFLVETHSEHLFRRMQTLIAQGRTDNDNVAMYFVERKNDESELRRLEVDAFGTVKNWPEHFFGDSVGEARAQAMARAQRMREQAHG